eukprot:TRINITY_DN2395_c0_g4_i1.p2 TRINITY_DN2395_c0_g4~~TRINITY_DN2395_c0_g4_i1.p2  ORF type:complete len:104 (+),score=4.61 TRINITY_DN2395_c0_g4_i1:189-500(+)
MSSKILFAPTAAGRTESPVAFLERPPPTPPLLPAPEPPPKLPEGAKPRPPSSPLDLAVRLFGCVSVVAPDPPWGFFHREGLPWVDSKWGSLVLWPRRGLLLGK